MADIMRCFAERWKKLLILGIDTATKVCSVALCRDKEPVAGYEINLGRTHSEGLLPQLNQLFERTGIKKRDIDLIAVSIGPGSFTGLRIGLATAEAIAYAWRIPICGVDTLKAMAYNLPIEGVVMAPVLDAQKGNYYLGMYEWRKGRLSEKKQAAVVGGEKLMEKLGSVNKQVVLMGECEKLFSQKLPDNVAIAPDQVRMPKATSVAIAGFEQAAAGGAGEPFAIDINYIRRSEAEELWEKKQKKI